MKQPVTIRFSRVPGQRVMNRCYVDCGGRQYVCRQGESVTLPLDAPAQAVIRMQNCFGRVSATLEPGQTYLTKVNLLGFVRLQKE